MNNNDLIKDFCQKYFSNESYIVLVGSNSKKFLNPNTDIDLLIISKNTPYFIENRIQFRGIIFHIFSIFYPTLFTYIASELRYTNSSIIANMLLNSDTEEKYILQKIKNNNSDFFLKMKYYKLLKIRYKIGELVLILQDPKINPEDFLLTFNQIFSLLIDKDILLETPLYKPMEKRRIKNKLTSSKREDYYNLSKQILFKKKNYSYSVINYTNNELRSIGGYLTRGSSNNLLEKYDGGALSIVINSHKKKLSELVTTHFFLDLTKILDNYSFYTTSRLDNSFIPIGLYIIIDEKENIIQDLILPSIDKFKLKIYKNEDVTISYPCNIYIDEGIELGGKDFYDYVKNTFYLLSKSIIKKHYDNRYNFSICLYTIRKFLFQIFDREELIYIELKKIYEYYLLKIINTSTNKKEFREKKRVFETKIELWKKTTDISPILKFTNLKIDILMKGLVKSILNKKKSDVELSYFRIGYIEEIFNITIISLNLRPIIIKILLDVNKQDV